MGEAEYTSSERSLTSAENVSAGEADVLSDDGTRDPTDSGSEAYTSGGDSGDEYERFFAQFLGPNELSPHKRTKP